MASGPPPPTQALAEAASRRRAGAAQICAPISELTQEHDKRQAFRRLIDPGIFRPNSKEIAMDSLKTLSTIAENILREPENPKFQSFKHENDTIKRRLIQPKGALEYALALGFRPKVTDFELCYVFNASKMVDLRVGAAMLREALERETQKEERLRRNKGEQKAAAAAAVQNVKLAFLDDRKSTMMRDERERESREARESARGSQSAFMALEPLPSSDQSPTTIPGVGHTLAPVDCDSNVDQPSPHYD